MADSPVELPSRLAILPFRNKVLLPGAIVRIRCTNPSSVKLVEQELWQKEEKGLIGVLPVRDSEATAVGSLLSPGVGSDSGEGGSKVGGSAGESSRQDTKNGKEPIHWHSKGVAARALHLSRGVEKPSGRVTYIVVLEGLCRFNVQELSARGPYHVARVSRLDMTKTELEQAEQDPDLIALSRQFKATAMELISVLEQRSRPGATYSLGAKADKKGSPLALTTGHSQVWPPPRQAIRHQPCLPESYQNTMVSILPKSSCP